MGNKLYVGNLPLFGAVTKTPEQTFSAHGAVNSARS